LINCLSAIGAYPLAHDIDTYVFKRVTLFITSKYILVVQKYIIRRMIWVGCVTCTRQKRCAYEILIGRREGKRPHGEPKCRWEFDR
jgi:putative transposon-encoded protein